MIEYLIYEMSTLKHPSPVEFELASEAPANDVSSVTVPEAAFRLGVCRNAWHVNWPEMDGNGERRG